MSRDSREKVHNELRQVTQDYSEKVPKALSYYDEFIEQNPKMEPRRFFFKTASRAVTFWVMVIIGVWLILSFLIARAGNSDLGLNLFTEAIGALVIFIILDRFWYPERLHIDQQLKLLRCGQLMEEQIANLRGLATELDENANTATSNDQELRRRKYLNEIDALAYTADELQRVYFELRINPNRKYPLD